MARTVTLKGDAAAAFMDGQMGKRAETDDSRIKRILAHIEMGLKDGTAAGRLSAGALLLSVASNGLEKTADLVTRKGG